MGRQGNGTAYIRISRFGTDTNNEDKVVSELCEMKELDAVIVDVREIGGWQVSGSYKRKFSEERPFYLNYR